MTTPCCAMNTLWGRFDAEMVHFLRYHFLLLYLAHKFMICNVAPKCLEFCDVLFCSLTVINKATVLWFHFGILLCKLSLDLT